MRKTISYMLVLCGMLMLASCGEDRTYEYEEKTQHNRWLLDEMRDQYLWSDALKDYEPAWKDYFMTPGNFLSAIAKMGDNDSWSYVVADTVETDVHERGYFNHLNSYGMDFVLVTDPTGMTTRSVARILTVYPDSPADMAGLKRNDFICSFDSYRLSSKNVSRLQKGGERTLEIRHIQREAAEGALLWADTTMVTLGASRYVEDVAFPVRAVVGVDGKKVGYIMCNRLVSGPAEQGNEADMQKYKKALDEAMTFMRSSAVDEMVIDLRLCNDGDLDMVQRMGSYLYNLSASGTTMLTTKWNDVHSANNRTVPYDASVPNVGVDKIGVITSAYTRGAAEWLVQALIRDMGKDNVVVVGASTAGQNVMTAEIGHDYNLKLCPVVAYICDADGNHDAAAITPDMQVDEQEYLNLGDYGSLEEILFYTAVELMHGRGQSGSEE